MDIQADSLAAISNFLDGLQMSERLILLQVIHLTQEGQAIVPIQFKNFHQGS